MFVFNRKQAILCQIKKQTVTLKYKEQETKLKISHLYMKVVWVFRNVYFCKQSLIERGVNSI